MINSQITVTNKEHAIFGRKSGDINSIHYDDRLGSSLGCEGKVIFGGLIIQKIFDAFDFYQNKYEIQSFDIRFNVGASLLSNINLLFEDDKMGTINFELEQFSKSIGKGNCKYKTIDLVDVNFRDDFVKDLYSCSEKVASWFGYDSGCAVIGRWSMQKIIDNSYVDINETETVAKVDPRFDIYTFHSTYKLDHKIEFRYFEGLNNWISNHSQEDFQNEIATRKNDRNALIIGGTGALGLMMKQNLLDKNYDVFCSSRYPGGDLALDLTKKKSSLLIYDFISKVKPNVISFCAIDKIDINTKMNVIFKNFIEAIERYAADGEFFSIFFPSTYYIDKRDIAISKGLEHYIENKLSQENELEILCKKFLNISVLIYRFEEFNSRQHALLQLNRPGLLDIELINNITKNLEYSGEPNERRRYKIITS